jgi:hypothetical protein
LGRQRELSIFRFSTGELAWRVPYASVFTAFVLGMRNLQVAIATKRIARRPLIEQLTVKNPDEFKESG